MKYLVVAFFVILIILGGCKEQQKEDVKVNIQENLTNSFVPEAPIDMSFRTSDGVIIRSILYPNANSKRALILLHQLGKDKSSYDPYIIDFQKEFNVLAIDLRGHGESDGDYKQFTDIDFINMSNDIEAAQNFMIKRGFPAMNISYIGASIGANTVQNFISKTNFDKAVLLSPGIKYRGIELNMQENNILVIVSKEDTFSYDTAKQLEKISPASKFIYLENKGHGTNMLDKELIETIIKYLK